MVNKDEYILFRFVTMHAFDRQTERRQQDCTLYSQSHGKNIPPGSRL